MKTIGLLLLGTLLAYVAAMCILVPALNPPMGDVRQLFLFMATTGGITVSLSYLLYHFGIIQRLRSLRNMLLASSVVTVTLVFVNVWFVAHLMFISTHDLVLTTSLLAFAGIISIMSSYLFANTLTHRIGKLSQAAQELAQGNLHTRLPISGNDEIASLTQTFNHMVDSLAAVDEQKRQLDQTRRDLIAWVSHDLRTPLTAIRVMNEALVDGVVTDPQTVTRYIQNSQREVENLSHLIDDLFELAQIDAGHLKLVYQATSLRDLLSDTLGSMKVQAESKHIQLSGHIDNGVDMVCVAPDKIQRVLYNLVDNALRYTAPGGTVTLNVALDPSSQVRVKVHNSGSTIAPKDMPHIFERFYQGETSRTAGENTRRGAGLGLAIARGFVEAHRGKIWAESENGGTSFIFTLPLT